MKSVETWIDGKAAVTFIPRFSRHACWSDDRDASTERSAVYQCRLLSPSLLMRYPGFHEPYRRILFGVRLNSHRGEG